MHTFNRALVALLGGLALVAAYAVSPAKAEGIGVVLLHARGGVVTIFDNVGARIKEAGYGEIAPDVCWSRRRLYGGSLDECMADIDTAIATLREQGFDQVVVGGHAMGALAAMYYAGNHSVAGVLAWGPQVGKLARIEEDRAEAVEAMEAGKGDDVMSFFRGRPIVTPRVLLSFEGLDSPLADQAGLVSHLSAPLLWIDSNDSIGPRDPTPIFNQAPEDPLNTFIRSTTDYFSMVDKSADDVIAWLDKLKAANAVR